MTTTLNVFGAINFMDMVVTVKEPDKELIALRLTSEQLFDALNGSPSVGLRAVVIGSSNYKQLRTFEVVDLTDDEVNLYVKALEYVLELHEKESASPGVYTPQTIDEARERRNSLLKNSDWTVLPDSPLTEEKVAMWKVYRQELRDLFQKYSTQNPEKIIWPSAPG